MEADTEGMVGGDAAVGANMEVGVVVGGEGMMKEGTTEGAAMLEGDVVVEAGASVGEGIMKGEGAMMEDPPEAGTQEQQQTALPKGAYTSYEESRLSYANAGDVVLFFHAPWCPYCRAADNDINARLNEIPDGLLILKTDYDSATALKKKYGVTYQHTFVQVDAQGNMIKKWSSSQTLDAIVKEAL